MVIAVVIPSFDTRTAANRDVAEANLYFPEGNDIGTDIVDISIVLIYKYQLPSPHSLSPLAPPHYPCPPPPWWECTSVGTLKGGRM